jgi:hypothetical protein
MGLWEHATAVPVATTTAATTTTGARRVLRRLALTTTCADLDAYGVDLAYYFNVRQYSPKMIAAIVKDAKAEYATAIGVSGYSNTDLFTTLKTKCGFLDADVILIASLTAEATKINASPAAAHYHEACGKALKNAANQAASTKLYQQYAREIMEKKYESAKGAGKGVAATGERTIADAWTNVAVGAAGHFALTTDLTKDSHALIKKYIPFSMASGDYNCQMGFIVDREITRVELVNAVYIAESIKTAHYASATTLTTADKEALYPATVDAGPDYTKDVNYTRAQTTLTADKEYKNGDNADLLNKQLGIGAVGVQRSTQAAVSLLKTDVAVGTTAITDIERIVYGIYNYADYFGAVYPKAKQDTFIKAIRAANATANKQPGAGTIGTITYDVSAGGYSLYQLEASKQKKAADASPKGVLAITRTGLSGDANDKGLASFYATEIATVKGIYAETVLCKNSDTSAKLAKCLDEAYYVADALRRHNGYKTNGTDFAVDVLQYQLFYSKLSFAPQLDIKTESGVAIDPTAPTKVNFLQIGGWYSELYYTHKVQFFSVIDMILVEDWATLNDTGSDIFKKLFVTDSIDSVKLQEIITASREYSDFTGSTTPTDATVNA